MNKIFTSESVGRGHPDKICDQIADKILDEILNKDKEARVAVEVMASNRLIIIGGEITTNTYVDLIKCAWEVLFSLNYNENDFTIISNVNSQSKEINHLVNQDGEIGAGDQGIVFGYATNKNKEMMPLPILLAHKLVANCEELRIKNVLKKIKPDMKSQVSIDFSNENNPKIQTILMSIQHDESLSLDELRKEIKEKIILPTIKEFNLNDDCEILINPKGKFTIGGPVGDSGLTGRKIIVDTYGGFVHHGGGAFSGKDYTKTDRSGAYMARYIAKNLVAAEVCDEIEIQIAFGIGLIKPISILINCFNTNKIPLIKIYELIQNIFDLSPKGIIKQLDLKNQKYFPLSYYGHFGRIDLEKVPEFEKTNKVNEIKQWISKNLN